MEGIRCSQLVIEWLAVVYEEYCHFGGSALVSLLADRTFSSGSSYITLCEWEPMLLGPYVLIPATVATPFMASTEVAHSIWLISMGESFFLLGCLVPLSW